MRSISSLLFITVALTCLSCVTQRPAGSAGDRSLYRTIARNEIFGRHHTGFALYDPESSGWLCTFNAEKYFTPASNTKILTLYTCLHALPDTLTSLRYTIRGDSLLFTGTGDPSLLFTSGGQTHPAMAFLSAFPGKLFYLPGDEIVRYGKGWAWDDYPYPFQVEKSTMPVYGNRIRIYRDMDGTLIVMPRYFTDYVLTDTTIARRYLRDASSNMFTINPLRIAQQDTIEIPFMVSDYETARLLSDTLHKPIGVIYDALLPVQSASIHGALCDSLLKPVMQDSDNFIAEHLLMQCAYRMRGVLDTDSAIAVAKRTLLQGLADLPNWVDGSGISRYNLLTPRSIVQVLEAILSMQGKDYVRTIFPAGGRSGTISSWYAAEPPFVYAKTGSLRNQHCLSGYLITDKGRWLIFSFMHNHMTLPGDDVRREMDRILRMIKAKY